MGHGYLRFSVEKDLGAASWLEGESTIIDWRCLSLVWDGKLLHLKCHALPSQF